MSFDRLARHYSWMERLLAGDKLQQCRTIFLDEMRDASSVLVVGEGHGRFLPELCRVNRNARITCIDASAEMIRIAQAGLSEKEVDSRRVIFHATPILKFESSHAYDLIVTHFFLDCFDGTELQEVITRLTSLLQAGGKWIIADFQVPESGWRRLRAQLVLALAYGFFRAVVRLPARRLCNPAPLLASAGMKLSRKEKFNFELLYAAVWERQ